MSFQSSVYIQQGAGVAGEQFSDSHGERRTYTINSAEASYNNIGSAMCSVTSQGFCAAGNSGGTAVFAGLLVDPKDVALYGTGGAPLSAHAQRTELYDR